MKEDILNKVDRFLIASQFTLINLKYPNYEFKTLASKHNYFCSVKKVYS